MNTINPLYFIIFFLSVSLLGLQVVIIYLLSIIQWYHFAYMIISASLLGFGASGSFLSIFKKKLLKIDNIIFYLLILSSLSSGLSIYALTQQYLSYDSYLLFTDISEIIKLFINYIIFFLPFFFGALVLAIVFVQYPENINKIYFSNLMGSSVGAIVPLLLINILEAESLIPVFSMVMLIAAVVSGIYTTYKKSILSIFLILLNFFVIIFIFFSSHSLNVSEYKDLSYALNLHNTKVKGESQSIYGLMKYVETPLIRYAPGISLTYTNKLPVVDMIYLNSESLGPVFKNKDDLLFFNNTSAVIPYLLGQRDSVLILDAGTFSHAYFALTKNAENITAVDLFANETIRLKQKYSSNNYFEKITIKSVDPKSYILTTDEKYDLISISSIDSFGGGAGLSALQENYTVTIESFIKQFNLLKEDGMIYIPVWTDNPPRNFLKILAMLTETVESKGLKPKNHIIAVRDWSMLHFFLKKSSLTHDDFELIKSFAKKNNFDIATLNGFEEINRNRFNIIDDSFFEYIDEIMFGDRNKFYNDYNFNIKPPIDDKPYFFNFIKWRTMYEIVKSDGFMNYAFNELGYLIVVYTFIQIFIMAVLLIIIPLFKLKKKLKSKFYSISYFSFLGLGYMFFEILLIQRFTLYFGSPVYSTAFIISFMLAVSGLGSFVSSKILPSKKNIFKICSIISFLMILFFVFSNTIIYSTIDYSLILKIFISFLIISPLAFFMGMPFPTALKFISKTDESAIPWCWGINGCLSVIAAVAAVIVSVEYGFFVAGLVAFFCYLFAALLNRFV